MRILILAGNGDAVIDVAVDLVLHDRRHLRRTRSERTQVSDHARCWSPLMRQIERQALAIMDHPNIAKVLDAGATDGGRPYFVMELVRGIPITEYCDQQQVATRQRLELFAQVCRAVQHAHQKGIIHRDLKPNNVLVTVADDGRPVPKIIDFGISKATMAGQRLTEQTLFTHFQQMIATPLYMSPEQAEMSTVTDVDTRSDVYSLGVLLYELLTGTTPFAVVLTAGFKEEEAEAAP